MKPNCSRCPHNESGYDPYSNVCESCMHDPDTGWGGFTDHRVDRHFYTQEEQVRYYEEEYDDEYDPDN